MNPDRNMQISLALLGERASIILPVRRLLLVPALGKERVLPFMKHADEVPSLRIDR